jgi:protein-tyrosine phosphatase
MALELGKWWKRNDVETDRSGTTPPPISTTPPSTGAPRPFHSERDGSTGSQVRSGLQPTASTGAGYGKRTDPIPVDFLNVPGASGRIGMCFAPGKGGPTAAKDPRPRDVDVDLDRIVNQLHAKVLVPLIEDHELKMLEIPDLVQKAEARGMHVERYPIKDMGVPSDMAKTRDVVKKIAAHLKNDENVIIHCRGGWGRTGMIAACVLVEMGVDPAKAIQNVRMARNKTIQTTQQEQFIHQYAESMGN